MANPIDDRTQAAAELDRKILECYACRDNEHLELTKPAIMHRGDARATIMAIGIAPGTVAAEEGVAFAGQSFARMHGLFRDAGYVGSPPELRNAMYLTSIVKCVPSSDTSVMKYFKACQKFLWQQLDIVRPRLVLLLGKEPIRAIAGTTTPMASIAGHIWSSEELSQGLLFSGIPPSVQWIALPHPSGLNRQMNDGPIRQRCVSQLRQALQHIGFLQSQRSIS